MGRGFILIILGCLWLFNTAQGATSATASFVAFPNPNPGGSPEQFEFQPAPVQLTPANKNPRTLALTARQNGTNNAATAQHNIDQVAAAREAVVQRDNTLRGEITELEEEMMWFDVDEKGYIDRAAKVKKKETERTDLKDNKIPDLNSRENLFNGHLAEANRTINEANASLAKIAAADACNGGCGGHGPGGGGGGGGGGGILGLLAGAAIGAALLGALSGGDEDEEGNAFDEDLERSQEEREERRLEAERQQQEQRQFQIVNLQNERVAEEVRRQNEQQAALITAILTSKNNKGNTATTGRGIALSSRQGGVGGSATAAINILVRNRLSSDGAAECFSADRQRVPCDSPIAVFCFNKGRTRVSCR